MAADSCPKLAEFEGVYIAIATGDTSMADGDAVRAALAHAEACPACAAELAAHRKLHQRLTPPRLSDDAAARIAARVRAAAHARIRAWERRRRLLRVAAALCAAAAVVLLAVVFWPQQSADGPTLDAVVAEAPHPGTPVVVSPAPAAPGQAPAAPRPTRIARHSVPAPAPISPEQQKLLDEAARLRGSGRRHLQARQYDRAEGPLREAVALMDGLLANASDTEAASAALYEKYRCHELLGEYLERESAFRAYLRDLRRDQGDEAAARELVQDARRLICTGDSETAGRRLEQALALTPNGPVAVAAHAVMASAAERQRLFDLAHSQYRMALQEKPPPRLAAAIYRNMIALNAYRGRLDAAVADAEVLCALPREGLPPQDCVRHRCLLARLHRRSGETGKAVRLLRSLVAEHPIEHTRVARFELESLVHDMVEKEVFK